jgi:hypothetical protein
VHGFAFFTICSDSRTSRVVSEGGRIAVPRLLSNTALRLLCSCCKKSYRNRRFDLPAVPDWPTGCSMDKHHERWPIVSDTQEEKL